MHTMMCEAYPEVRSTRKLGGLRAAPSSDSFESEHLIFVFITLTWENALSTTPFEAGRENKSSHCDTTGA